MHVVSNLLRALSRRRYACNSTLNYLLHRNYIFNPLGAKVRSAFPRVDLRVSFEQVRHERVAPRAFVIIDADNDSDMELGYYSLRRRL